MKIHNKIEIEFKNRTENAYFESVNSMLSPLLPALCSLEMWNKYLVFGKGVGETQPQQTTLNEATFSHLSQVTLKQTNPLQGVCYAKKTVLFDENDLSEFEFSEVGICSQELTSENLNPNCMSRFLIKDKSGNVQSVKRKSSEQMFVTVTVYLERDEESKVNFVAGDNNILVEALLGIRELTPDEEQFKVAFSNNFTPNNKIVERDEVIGSGTLALMTSSIEDGKAKIVLDVNLGNGTFGEFILVMGDIPVLRYNYQQDNIVNYLDYTESNSALWIYLNKPNIKQIYNCYSVTQNTYYSGFIIDKYGLGFSSVNNQPFDFPYTAETVRFISPSGDKIAFVYADRVDVYSVESGQITRLDTSNITLPYGLSYIGLDKNYLILLCTVNDVSSLHYYFLQDGVYLSKNIDLSGHFALSTSLTKWDKFGLVVLRGDQIVRIGVIETLGVSKLTCINMYIDADNNLYWSNTYNSTDTAMVDMCMLPPNTFFDGMVMATRYYPLITSGVIRYIDGNSFKLLANKNISHFIYDNISSKGIFGGGRAAFGYKASSVGIGVVEIGSRFGKNILGNGADKIFMAHTYKYIARVFSDRVEFSYFNTNNVEIPFTGTLPLSIDSNLIEEILMLDGIAIFFTNDAEKPLFAVNFFENKNLIHHSSVTAGDEMRVTYDYHASAGEDGNPVNVKFKIEV